MNEEEKTYKKLIADLKNLPKIDAPKNFETELLRKINSSEVEKKESFWDKILSPGKLAPAAIAIASAAIIFFVIDINSEEMEDPLNIAPRLREDLIIVESINDIPIEPLKKSGRVKEQSKNPSEGLIEKKKLEEEPRRNEVSLERSNLKSKSADQSITDELTSDKTDSDKFETTETRNLGESVAPSATTLASEISKADSFESEMKREKDRIENLPVVKGSSDNVIKDNINFMQRNLSLEEKIEVQQLKKQVQAEKSSKTDQKSNKLP